MEADIPNRKQLIPNRQIRITGQKPIIPSQAIHITSPKPVIRSLATAVTRQATTREVPDQPTANLRVHTTEVAEVAGLSAAPEVVVREVVVPEVEEKGR